MTTPTDLTRPPDPTLDTVKPEKVQWLWDGHLPRGKAVGLDSDPGKGKTTLCMSLAASASAGRPWPDGSLPRVTGGVVMLTAEDGLADTVVPRLIAVGADLSRIICLHSADAGDHLWLPDHIERLTRAMEQVSAVLVIADPLEHYLQADIIKGQQQRAAMGPVLRLLADRQAVLVFTRHLNQQAGQKALYRGRGDMTMLGIARMGFLVADDPDEPGTYIMAPTKANLAIPPPALRYRIAEATNGAAYIDWMGISTRNADQLVGNTDASSGAEEVLRTAILPRLKSDGPILASEGDAILAEHGIRSRDTINRAKKKLGIKSAQRKIGEPWFWLLSGQTLTPIPPQTEYGRNVGMSEPGPDSDNPSDSVIPLRSRRVRRPRVAKDQPAEDGLNEPVDGPARPFISSDAIPTERALPSDEPADYVLLDKILLADWKRSHPGWQPAGAVA